MPDEDIGSPFWDDASFEKRAKRSADSQPIRQDGDGLLAAFKPFADFMAGGMFDKLSDETRLTAGSPIARRQLTIGDLRKLAEAVATSQSRGAAEGAGADRVRVWDENRGAYFLQDVPPQPAHGAMRAFEMLIAQLIVRNDGVGPAVFVREQTLPASVYNAALDAISAPIPPADEARVSMGELRKVISDEWGSHLCYRNSTTAERVCALGHCRCEDIARAILANFALSSATGAAADGAMREQFEKIITSLRYDGDDPNSLTVGEIRRALL
jgi:hypothetical protein